MSATANRMQHLVIHRPELRADAARLVPPGDKNQEVLGHE